eukprot:7031341-Alexandrium_andersonii.AAC.1
MRGAELEGREVSTGTALAQRRHEHSAVIVCILGTAWAQPGHSMSTALAPHRGGARARQGT